MNIAEFRRIQFKDESAFQAAVIGYAKTAGWLVFHVSDSRKEVARQGVRVLVGDQLAKGYPDLTLVHPDLGRFLVRELKSTNGRLTPAQKQWLACLRGAGIDAAVWRPQDLPAIEQTLAGRQTTRERRAS